MAAVDSILSGLLYVEVGKVYEEMFCLIEGKRFSAYRRAKINIPASLTNRGDLSIQFDIHPNECEVKSMKFGLAELTKIMKNSKLPETPLFFKVSIMDKNYILGASSEEERNNWLKIIKSLCKNKERKSDAWISTGFLQENGSNLEGMNRFGTPTSPENVTTDTKYGPKLERPMKDDQAKKSQNSSLQGGNTLKRMSSELKRVSADENKNLSQTNDDNELEDELNVPIIFPDDDEEDDENRGYFSNCPELSIFKDRKWFIKSDTLIRMMKVCIAFPFVIVVSSLNLSNKYTFLRSSWVIRLMNVLIYVAPVVYVKFVLSVFDNAAIQRVAIGMYILLYLLPVGYVVFSKVFVSSSTSTIEEGTFCFKPARVVRLTQANFYAVFAFVMEWLQHILYVLPHGIVTGNKQAKLSDYPPFLPFSVYFWISAICAFLCGLIIVLNAVLRGKLHYRFQRSYSIWYFLFNVGSPLYVTIVTILLMSLWCDYSVEPSTLIQQPNIVCNSHEHSVMSRAALIALAIYLIQHTLLPSGTFKETMTDNDLEIMFVPVYLQAHYLLKAIFCGVYVYFYDDNFSRVIVLTIINMLLLALNNYMKPCSVDWVNLMRDGFFVHATLSGIISLNYLAWPENDSTKGMVISTLASTVLFSTIGLYVYYRYTAKSTEYSIAAAFLDLEWQVSRGGSVHPRVLEPLISLTLSKEASDWVIAKKYIGQLVWLISYPNMRVQFQSAWGIANLALLDEDARVKIDEAGGTKTLFEWYTEMDALVQLETLAAMANLTLSPTVSEEMVNRHKCIPFFIELISSSKLKHAQFSAIAIANLARKESFRELIRKAGGIQALVSCLMSHDYNKRRHACRALANIALSPSKEVEQIFESKGLIDRIIKMALRKETETQQEVIALIRNITCHSRLRPLLLDRNVMAAVETAKTSVFENVRLWYDEIRQLLEREISSGSIDLKALMRREGAKGSTLGEADVDLLKRMEPLQGEVGWHTWGSKLETIFEPVFSTIPSLTNSQVRTAKDTPTAVYLPHGISKAQIHRWRDILSYSIIERPAHGKLSEYSTTSDYVTYVPTTDYIGTDFFSYRMVLGSLQANPVTVSISIVPEDFTTPDDLEKAETGGRLWRSNSGSGSKRNSAPKDFDEVSTNEPSVSPSGLKRQATLSRQPSSRNAANSPMDIEMSTSGGSLGRGRSTSRSRPLSSTENTLKRSNTSAGYSRSRTSANLDNEI